jgi:benzil reductase ((S)-benzoin forming)
MKHIIITGHSKGLGAGIAMNLINENHHIHGISRTDNSELQILASARGCKMTFYPCDLSHTDSISPVMDQIFHYISEEEQEQPPTGMYLINNAGVVGPIGPAHTHEPAEIDWHIRINLMAPFLLTSDFIRHASAYQIQKRVINISSGAAVNPYEGLSIYCIGKAGLDMITRSFGLEQEKEKHPTEVMSIAPGVIDTHMQTYMRAVPDEKFKQKDRFVQLKEKGQLISPETAGRKFAEILFSSDFKNGEVTDIRGLY